MQSIRQALSAAWPVFAVALAVAAALSGCAAPAKPAAKSAEAVPSGRGWFATIVIVRPTAGHAGPVLAALGGHAAAVPDNGTSEFILRDDAGRTVSVVQTNAERLRAGETVRLVGEGHTRLVRWATGAAPSA